MDMMSGTFRRSTAMDILMNQTNIKVSHVTLSLNEYYVRREDGNVYNQKDQLVEDWSTDKYNEIRSKTSVIWNDGWRLF